MKLMREVSRISDASGSAYRPVHYLAGVCSALYMSEAIAWAAANGGITGPKIRDGMYAKANWVPKGAEGVCKPSSWTMEDHRPSLQVDLYRVTVSGPTDGPVDELVRKGVIKLAKVTTIDLPRKKEWLGW
jgi:branched-chain amino acid transport system substrate-binding protein